MTRTAERASPPPVTVSRVTDKRAFRSPAAGAPSGPRPSAATYSPRSVPAGGWNRALRHEQRARDVDTVRAFSSRAVRELGIERRHATATTATLLAAIDPVLAQWRLRPTPEHAALLEDIYMGMVSGAYRAIPAASPKD